MEKLPIGSGKEIISKRRESTLPALEVENTVIWKNPAFNVLPFKIELGKKTPLGVFFTPDVKQYPEEHTRQMTVMPEYQIGRSGSWAPVIFRDRDGNLWRDIDIKGIGHFTSAGTIVRIEKDELDLEDDPRKYKGLMDYEFAQRDRNYSEKFLRAGIRTHRVIALTDIEEI